MDRFDRRFILFLLLILLDSPIICHSWGWSSSSSTSSRENTESSFSRCQKSSPEFSMEVFSDQKAVRILEDAKNKLVGPNSCWQNAYGHLFSGCKEMVATEETRKRFAWHLSDCFLKDSGRPAFPTLQRLGEFSQKQQEELAKRQEKLQQVHDHLFENSKSMLAAQEAFEAKQASMFVALDKLFALHNAMLLESRVIKAFFIYFLSIFVILALEVAVLRFVNDTEHQRWIINLVRDYEVLNHQILLRLVDKFNDMQSQRSLSWDEDAESDIDWTTWIDTDLSDDDDNLGDPDYKFPEEIKDNPVFTPSMTRRLYNLRPR